MSRNGQRPNQAAHQTEGSMNDAPTSSAQATLSLVLPMFNEEESVEQTLREALRSLESNFGDFEIIVVDDGSTDGCAAKVESWAARDSRIVLIRMVRNTRFGGALRRGLETASKEFVLYTDFDLPVPLDFVPEILRELARVDVVTGYSPEIPKNLSWNTRLISRTYNFLVHSAFGLPLRDVNFGLKAMRKSTLEKFRLTSRSPFVDAELFLQAIRSGCRIGEIAVPFSLRQHGVSRIRRPDVIARTFFDMAYFFLWGKRNRSADASANRHPAVPVMKEPAKAEASAGVFESSPGRQPGAEPEPSGSKTFTAKP
jgi:glycosyltransferase involved in cell wall biosynthesis